MLILIFWRLFFFLGLSCHIHVDKGVIANSIMVEDPALTTEEAAEFDAVCATLDFEFGMN